MPYNNTPIAPSKEVTGHVSLPLARVQKIIQADPERLTVTKNASFAIALATEMFVQHLSLTTHNVVKTERKPRRNIQYRDVSSAVGRTDNLEFLGDVVPRTVQYGSWKRKKAAEEEREGEAVSGVLGETAAASVPAAGAKGKGKAEAKKEARNGETQTTLPGIPIASLSAQELLARAGDGQTTSTTIEGIAPVGQTTPQTAPQLDPLSRKELVPPVPETEAMDVDDQQADSEAEEDPAAMQIEMEMRGPPALRGEGKAAEASDAKPAPRISSGGFTAINGR